MIRDAISRVIREYKTASDEAFAEHPLATFIRRDIPPILEHHLENKDRYKIVGLAGKGNWVQCPWIAILDSLITDSAQSGYYPVYLFREDLSGVYLSLNQGVTEAKLKYKSEVKEALRTRARDFLSQIGTQVHFPLTEIDLKPGSPSNLSAFYEVGNICACFYESSDLPDDGKLEADFREMFNIYDLLSYNETVPVSTSEREQDEKVGLLIEDLRILRQHKRVERNIRLAKEAKRIHGLTCKLCGFNFEDKYGDVGKGYIEAHHLQPLSKLKGEKLLLGPEKDFTVLCANCHRMIHRSETPYDLDKFRERII